MAKLVTGKRPTIKKRTWGYLFYRSPVSDKELVYIKKYHKVPDEATVIISEDPATLVAQYVWTWFETSFD